MVDPSQMAAGGAPSPMAGQSADPSMLLAALASKAKAKGKGKSKKGAKRRGKRK